MNTLLEALSELKESASKRRIAANILCLGTDETNKDAYAYWENFEVDSGMDADSMIRYIQGHCKMMYGNTIVYLITDVDTKETIYWEHQPSLYEATKSTITEEATSVDEWKELTPEEVVEFSKGTKWCFNPEIYADQVFLKSYLDQGYTFYGKGVGKNRLLKAVNKAGKELGPYDINDRKVSE